MFFQRICDILFLPLAVTLFGAVPLFFVFRKYMEDRAKSCILLILLALMIAWRIPMAGDSTRYWCVILFPTILFVVYFLNSHWIGKRISRLLMVILAVFFFAKDFRLNWNNRAITNAAAAIREDAKAYHQPLASELRITGLLERIGYYSHVPTLSSSYCDGLQIQNLYEPARGLYDVLYVIAEDTSKEHLRAWDQMKRYNASVLFFQYKDMRKKKKVYVYKFEISPQANPKLPIQRQFADDNWWNWSIKYLNAGDPLHEKSLFFHGPDLGLLFSPMITPERADACLLFSVRAKQGCHIRIYCLGYDKKDKEIFHKVLMNTVIPQNKEHQFQIPITAAEFAPAVKVNYRWYVISPYGMYMDNVGFFDYK